MTFEEYTQVITQINKQLESIAQQTANQALLKCAHEGNPNFVNLMKQHQNLIAQSQALSEAMMKKFKE